MTFQYVLLAFLGVFILYVLALPKQTVLRKTFILFVVLLMVIFIFQPDLSTRVANWFGIGRGADFLFYLSNLVLFFVAFIYYLKFKDMEIRFARLVRHMAITQAQTPVAGSNARKDGLTASGKT